MYLQPVPDAHLLMILSELDIIDPGPERLCAVSDGSPTLTGWDQVANDAARLDSHCPNLHMYYVHRVMFLSNQIFSYLICANDP